MDKSPDAFRTISEVADWLDTPTHVLRFWESRFSQVKPVKRAGGRRYYRPSDMALLGGIKKLLHEDGLTIRGVQKILREEGVKHVAAMSPPVDGSAEAAIAEDVAPAPVEAEVVSLTPEAQPETPVAASLEPETPVDATPEPEAPLETAPEPADAPVAAAPDSPVITPDTAAEAPDAEPESEPVAASALPAGFGESPFARPKPAAPVEEPAEEDAPDDAAAALEPADDPAPFGTTRSEPSSTEPLSPQPEPDLEPASAPPMFRASHPAAEAPLSPDAGPAQPADVETAGLPETEEVLASATESTPVPPPDPEDAPDETLLGQEVLAALAGGARPDAAALRPLYDRLAALREKLDAEQPR